MIFVTFHIEQLLEHTVVRHLPVITHFDGPYDTWEMPPASADTLLNQAVGNETQTRLDYNQRTGHIDSYSTTCGGEFNKRGSKYF
jgi:hypothetical protein